MYWLHRAEPDVYGAIADPDIKSGVGSPKKGSVPLLLVRYEDMLADPQVIPIQHELFLYDGI